MSKSILGVVLDESETFLVRRAVAQLFPYSCAPTVFKYATTALASCALIRNGIIGKRNGCPFVQIPVVSNFTISASLAGGFPPILGATSGQFEFATDGANGTDAPCNHRLISRFP